MQRSESAESSCAAEVPARAHKPYPCPHPSPSNPKHSRSSDRAVEACAASSLTLARPHPWHLHRRSLSCCPLPDAPRPAWWPPPGQTCAQVESASGAAGAGRLASAGRPARIGPTAPRSPWSPTQARWPRSTTGAPPAPAPLNDIAPACATLAPLAPPRARPTSLAPSPCTTSCAGAPRTSAPQGGAPRRGEAPRRG